MKYPRQLREPLVRMSVMTTLAGLLITMALVGVPSSAAPAEPDPDSGPDISDPAAEAKRLAHEAKMADKQAKLKRDRDVLLPQLGTRKNRAQVTRGANSQYKDVSLAFKLDSRLTTSIFMGSRWVSPSTFIKTGNGPSCTVQATVRGVDNQGRSSAIQAKWTVADPSLVTLSESPGKPVEITVNSPGETTLEVTAPGFAKKLPLRALSFNGTLVVEINQQ